MDDTWMLPAAAFGAWLVALSLQLADLGTAHVDARLLARGSRTVVRLHPVAWVVPLGALVVVGVGIGLDRASRLLFDEGQPLAAVLVGIGLVVLLVAGWLAVTAAATRSAADSYRALRDELVGLAGTRVQQERLEELRARLSVIDDRDSTSPPRAASTGAAARWASLRHTARRPQRMLPPLTAVLLLVLVLVSVPTAEESGRGWAIAAAAVAVLLSTALAIVGARASLVLLGAVRRAQVGYRAEVVHLLAEAEKTAKKPVAGLGERVSRALQILREQQG